MICVLLLQLLLVDSMYLDIDINPGCQYLDIDPSCQYLDIDPSCQYLDIDPSCQYLDIDPSCQSAFMACRRIGLGKWRIMQLSVAFENCVVYKVEYVLHACTHKILNVLSVELLTSGTNEEL